MNYRSIFRIIDLSLTGITNKFGVFNKSLSDVIRDMRNGQGVAKSFLNNLVYKNGLSKNDVKQITSFIQQCESGTPTVKAWNNTMLNASANAKRAAKDIKMGKASLDDITYSANNSRLAMLGATAATTALNVALTLGISLAIQGVIQLVDYWAKSQERANEAVKDAAQKLSELKNELKSLDDYKDKISSLRDELDKGNLSLGDANKKREELLTLQDELIDKYGKEEGAVKNIRAAILGEVDALDQLSKQQMDKWLTNNKDAIATAKKYANESIGVSIGAYYNDDPEISRQIRDAAISLGFAGAVYEGSSQKDALGFGGTREEIINKMSKFREWLRQYCRDNNVSTDIRDYFLNGLDDQENYITDKNADDGNFNNQMSVYRKAIEYEIAVNHSELYESLTRSKKQYEDAIISGDTQLAKTAYDSFQKTIKDFGEKIKNGDDSLTDAETAYIVRLKNDLENELSPVLKIDLEGTKREFDSSYEDLVRMYAKVGDAGFTIGNVDYRGIPTGVEGFSDITIAQASEFNVIRDAAKEAGVSIESYIEALVQYGKVQKKVAGTQTEELSIGKYSENIKAAQDAISPLLDAYNKLQKGELSNSDIVTLISDKFPSLIKYTDNLSVGIQKLAGEKLEELKTKLNEVDRSKLSEEDLKAYDKFIEYIDKLNDGFKSTLAYYEKIQSQTKSVSDNITTLIGLQKEIEENGGLSLSSMEKILSDESLTSLRPYLNDVKTMLPIINSLIEDQKQSYEDLYNEQQRLADPDAYIKAVEEKEKTDENAFGNAVKRINDAVKKFKEKYDVDVTNWDQIEDGKKNILENTNAELVGKTKKLINDFAEYYNTDLENFKNTTEAKQAILDAFATSKAGQAINDFALGMNNGHYTVKSWDLLTSEEQTIAQKYLSQLGWTYDDYIRYFESGFKEVTSTGDESLKKKLQDIVTLYTIPTDTWDSATKNIGASGGSGGSSSKEKTWFEKQYAYHNHLVNMEQEKQQDYLNWLDGAYKQAYSQGIIDLDAYYKYEEEVYNGRKKLAGDTSNWFERQYKEHQHLLKMEKEDEATYLKWLDSAYKKAYAEGLITLDEFRKYQEEVFDGIKKLKDNAESAINNLINIRINMLKEEVNKEKESINKRLDMLKDFYQKQKDMLQDKYDKEKYLDEQNEKRKKVSDIQAEIAALQMDDSAKAQKRRAELAVDLKDAQKDLTDFEKEHSLKTAQDQLDTLYENQEKAAKKKIEDLEKQVSSPQELYEQALADIRNGSQQLYNQMIKWNNVYGDGIRDTIKNAWEEAYKAEKQYFNYTGKHFNGVNLSNATGYIKGKTGYASGTSYATSGLHRVDEHGIETIFQSADGQRYRMFSSGEKVLNASASDFLYKFANKGREILEKLFNGTSRSYNNVNPGVVANNIQQGDIIIQGNADKATVSEIRRAQRDNLEQILKQFNKLK